MLFLGHGRRFQKANRNEARPEGRGNNVDEAGPTTSERLLVLDGL